MNQSKTKEEKLVVNNNIYGLIVALIFNSIKNEKLGIKERFELANQLVQEYYEIEY